MAIGSSPVTLWFIAAHDYGKQVAHALAPTLNLTEDINQEYVIQGPEALTQREAVDRFVRSYTAEKLTVLTVPSLLLKFGSLFSAQASYSWHIGEALNRYPELFEAEQTWVDLGKSQTNIDLFARNQ